jgi:NAD(P)H dehydrogenase (quinone)
MTVTPRVAVVYYSATGNVAAMARELAGGAEAAGAEVRLRRVAETAPPEAIASNPRWAEHAPDYEAVPLATLDDLEWADGIALGSPTRFGAATSQLRAFLDTTGGLWFRGALLHKVGTAFTTASTAHGGLESTILSINNAFYHWGCLILPLGYGPHVPKDAGNPYGASFVSRGGSRPDDVWLEACRAQGERLAQVAGLLVGARDAG